MPDHPITFCEHCMLRLTAISNVASAKILSYPGVGAPQRLIALATQGLNSALGLGIYPPFPLNTK